MLCIYIYTYILSRNVSSSLLVLVSVPFVAFAEARFLRCPGTQGTLARPSKGCASQVVSGLNHRKTTGKPSRKIMI